MGNILTRLNSSVTETKKKKRKEIIETRKRRCEVKKGEGEVIRQKREREANNGAS